MNTLKALLVDDEAHGTETLMRMLTAHCPNIKVVAVADSVKTAIEYITLHNPDVVFLDIEMPPGNGFDVLEAFPNPAFETIFVTAYHEYAIRALRQSAVDYLLKPVNLSELREAVDRLFQRKSNSNDPRYEALKEALIQTQKIERIVLPSSEAYRFVEVADIDYCRGDDCYTHFHLTDGRHHVVSKTLKEYDELLSDQGFFRIHKSFLVNTTHIKQVNKADGMSVLMSSGQELPVSQRRREEFMSLMRRR